MTAKQGFVLGGTLIVDRVKIVAAYPPEGTLVHILAFSKGIGGCPANNAVNLKTLDPGLPIAVIGCVGGDDDGRYVLDELRQRQVDVNAVRVTAANPRPIPMSSRPKTVGSARSSMIAERMRSGDSRTFRLRNWQRLKLRKSAIFCC
jgi:hypothetical protein